ncbi:MAG: hypothetical protein AAF533_01560 [Acidobacteriota bacterium]
MRRLVEALLARPAMGVALVAVVALVFSLLVVQAAWPPGFFVKYQQAAADPELAAQRLGDYSPLYLGLVQAVGGVLGHRGLLLLNCVLHAVVAVAVTALVGRLAGGAWGLLGGLLVATYRPLVVHAGIHEPELLLAACLALALAAGHETRHRLRVGEPGAARLTLLAATLALTLAGLCRPQWLVLLVLALPWWTAPAMDRAMRRRLVLLAGATALLVLGPVVSSRFVVTGSPLIMNPGPVFYEGNGPAATGLTRHAPHFVRWLERRHPESPDYGHVAYRRIASHVQGRELGPGESNEYWTGLALDGLRTEPAQGLRRVLHRAALSVGPHEFHDLVVTEDLDRRARARWPLGFGLLLLVVPLLGLVDRATRLELVAPLTVGLVAIGVQVVFYVSARQRLPLALALLVVTPAVLAALHRRWPELSSWKKWGSLGAGLLLMVSMTGLGSRAATLDQVGWDEALERVETTTPMTAFWRAHDGIAWAADELIAERTVLAEAQRSLGAGSADDWEPLLVALAGQDDDLTIDDRFVGVPAFWRAVLELRLGRREEAAAALVESELTGDEPVLVRALAHRLHGAPFDEDWCPAGIDPVSARWSLVRAALLEGDVATARELIRPLVESFPELRGTIDGVLP